jgi:hypothetical protein
MRFSREQRRQLKKSVAKKHSAVVRELAAQTDTEYSQMVDPSWANMISHSVMVITDRLATYVHLAHGGA